MNRCRWVGGLIGSVAILVGLMLVGAGCESGGSGGGANLEDYAGSLIGTWSGSGYSGTFRVTVNTTGRVTGSYSGDGGGTISGTVDADGNLDAQASGRAGSGHWTGQLESRDGALASGSGDWRDAEGNTGSWQGP